MPTDADRNLRRANTIPRLPSHELLHGTVLQGVKADHHQPAARPQDLQRLWQNSFKSFQLLVDRNAQGLKGARGWMDARPYR